MDLATGIPNPIDVYRRQPPALPVPAPVQMAMNTSTPVLPTPVAPMVAPAPHVPTQMDVDTNELNRIKNTGAGVDQIQNPFLRGLARAGDIAASVFAPGIARSIPGTTLHHQVLVNQAENTLAKDQATQKAADESAKSQAEAELDTANAGHVNAETPEVAPNAASTRKVQDATARHLNDEAGDLENPKPNLSQAYATAVQRALSAGQDPAQDPVVQHLSDAITSLQKQPADKALQHVNLQGPKGPIAATYDPASGKYTDATGNVIPNPVPYEKAPTIRVNTGEARQAKNDVLKAYQPTLDSAERLNVMTESYEKAVKNHDQQAMLNLLANHLGMTMGLQKGARLTKDIIHEAQQSQPWLAGIKAHYDKDGYLSGVALGPEQMRQMVELGQQRYAEDAKKSRSTAQYLGAPDDGPERVPGEATIRYYVAKANGDPAKAKQLAIADGWTVK